MSYTDEHWMDIAIREAEKSRGLCSPNPFVGAAIVKDDKLIATGRTRAYGSDHAEVDAINKAGKSCQGATIYVTLEPCCHFGKTPPCTKAIIKAGLIRVVAGICDPNPPVAGKGFEELRKAGIQLSTGVRADKISEQNEAFLCNVQKQRPFIIWKAALSLDGKYAAEDGSSKWISNELSRRMVHRLRAGVDAVLSGIQSVKKDDAMLNVRGVRYHKQPLRILLDPYLELEPNSRFAQSAKDFPSLVLYRIDQHSKAPILSELGIELQAIDGHDDVLDLLEIIQVLNQRRVSSLLLESGNRLSESFWQARLIDKCMVFYGNKILGSSKAALNGLGIPNIADAIALQRIQIKKLKDNVLISGYPVFDQLAIPPNDSRCLH
ncbi:MAG: bifunctional diaminohydroxyphosphoribosylaminopyrimidine deaminase/5-amino-6-(5-phosphoribosylamino)uracil reductase RibD [Candidatus Cloacimonetes bacterium]|nr:bifunctional diaminohydroxyphosphoribosylaminopyrimidine deaminase/5-amino-6-(5-phosphoribosylamino)uracil reductase RibD [Candidatus Cloacimonadota bacterium]